MKGVNIHNSKVRLNPNCSVIRLMYGFGKKSDFAELIGSVSAFGFQSPGSFLETSFLQTFDATNFEIDASKLLPLLLEQLIALGQTAQQLKQALENNGYHTEKIDETISRLRKEHNE